MRLAAIAPRLGKLLLMLSSPQGGEVVAAARAIERTLHDAGHDWHDLVQALLAPPVPANPADLSGDKSTVWCCFNRRHLLSPRDRQFIEDLTNWHKPLSPKQKNWLCDIRERLEGGTAA
jgi:hypothetical protein